MSSSNSKLIEEVLQHLEGQAEPESIRRGLWEQWPDKRTDAIISHYMARRPKRHFLTLTLKLHQPSWRKVQNILWAQRIFTNLVHEIVEMLRESPKAVRHDGAFFCLHAMLLRRAELRRLGIPLGDRTTMLADFLTDCFTEPQDQEDQEEPEEPKLASSPDSDGKLQRPSRQRLPVLKVLTVQQYPLIHTLRRAAFICAARIILGFYIRSQKPPTAQRDTKDSSAEEQILDQAVASDDDTDDATTELSTDDVPEPEMVAEVHEMHQQWAAQWIRYLKAAETPIPRGRDRGKAFGEALAERRIRYGRNRGKLTRRPGKRRVRALKERLFTVEEITGSLAHVYVLLNRNDYHKETEVLQKALQAKHLWRRDERYRRKTRASYFTRYERQSRRELTSLDALSDEELSHYAEELHEMLDHATAFEAVAEAIEIYLQHAPPSYPFVENAPFDDRVARTEHLQALRMFRQPVPPAALPPVVDEADALHRKQTSIGEQLHRADYETTTRLLQAESAIGERRLLPLEYARTMRPPDLLPAFALLYRKYTPTRKELQKHFKRVPKTLREQTIVKALAKGYHYEYALAVVVHHSKWAFVGEDAADFFAPNIREGEYFYVNFPDVPFTPPPNVSLLVFPLECGEDYHEELHLRNMIERLRVEQSQGAQLTGTSKHAAKPKLPDRASIGTVKLITTQDGRGWYSCCAQFPVPVDIPGCRKPQAVLGVYRKGSGYSWALLRFDGTVIQTGELNIPAHVLPGPDDTYYAKNYPPAVANAIIDIAEAYDALIIFEDTWRRKTTTTLHQQNTTDHAHPSRKVFDEVHSRTLQKGLILPRAAYGISPIRCGSCGNKLDNLSGFRSADQCQACGAEHRSGHIQLPIAMYADTTRQPQATNDKRTRYVWALMLREHSNSDRAKAMADFLCWLIAEGDQDLERAGFIPLPAEAKGAALDQLGNLTAVGRPAFHIATSKRNYLAGLRPRRFPFKPRTIEAEVVVAVSDTLRPYAELWTQQYNATLGAPKTVVTTPDLAELGPHLADDNTDFLLLDRPLTDTEVHVASRGLPNAFCRACGSSWVGEEQWLSCSYESCGQQQRTTINGAIVVARVGWEQMVKLYDKHRSPAIQS